MPYKCEDCGKTFSKARRKVYLGHLKQHRLEFEERVDFDLHADRSATPSMPTGRHPPRCAKVKNELREVAWVKFGPRSRYISS